MDSQFQELARHISDAVEQRLASTVGDLEDRLESRFDSFERRLEIRLQVHLESLDRTLKTAAVGHAATLERIERQLTALNEKVTAGFSDHARILDDHNKRIIALEQR